MPVPGTRRERSLPAKPRGVRLATVAERSKHAKLDERPNPTISAAAKAKNDPSYARKSMPVTSRDPAVTLLYPAHQDTGVARELTARLVGGPAPTSFDEMRMTPAEALRLRHLEGEAAPKTDRPPRPTIEANRDIFGKPKPVRPAADDSARTLPREARDPITGRTVQPDRVSKLSGRRPASMDALARRSAREQKEEAKDIFGKPVPQRPEPVQLPVSSSPAPTGQVAAAGTTAQTGRATPRLREGASMSNIGQASLEEHYARVAGTYKAQQAQQAALLASTKSADKRHQDPASAVPLNVPTDIFGKPVATNEGSCNRKRPPDLGGEGVHIGDGVKTQSAAEKRALAHMAVPAAVRHVAAVKVKPSGELDAAVEDSRTATARENATSRVRLSARREEVRAQQHELDSTSPEAVARTSVLTRNVLRQSFGWGLRPLRLALRAKDADADGIITVTELRRALIAVGVESSEMDAEMYRRASSTPKLEASRVCIPMLMDALRGPSMAPSREDAVRSAYRGVKVLTQRSKKDEFAPVTLADLCLVFNPTAFHAYNPHDRASPRRLQAMFSRLWGAEFTSQAPVTEEHCVAFFRDISAGVKADAVFNRMMSKIFVATAA